MKDLFKTKNLAVMALLTAMNVVLSRFLSINTMSFKIGFTFLTVMMASYLFGYAGAVVVAGLGDVVGALLFPTGPFFPGFTLTAVLVALCYGVFINKKTNLFKISVAVILSEFVGSGLINTFWISYMYGSDFNALFVTRLTTQILPMIAVQIVTARLIFGKSMLAARIAGMIRKS